MVYYINSSWLMIISITSLISISKTMKGERRTTSNMQIIRSHTLQITQNTFNGNPMCISKSMHKLTYLVHSIIDIQTLKSEILKSTSNLTKLCRVIKQIISHHIQFRRRSRSINKFAGWHTYSIMNIKCILMLS